MQSKLSIKELSVVEEMDRKAMAALQGGVLNGAYTGPTGTVYYYKDGVLVGVDGGCGATCHPM